MPQQGSSRRGACVWQAVASWPHASREDCLQLGSSLGSRTLDSRAVCRHRGLATGAVAAELCPVCAGAAQAAAEVWRCWQVHGQGAVLCPAALPSSSVKPELCILCSSWHTPPTRYAAAMQEAGHHLCCMEKRWQQL